MQRIYVYFILSSLALSCLLLTCLALHCLEWTSITIVIIGMTLYELVLHYNIISYHIISYFFLFYWIRFTILFSIVSHINEWFVSICPSIRLSVCLSVSRTFCFLFFNLHSFITLSFLVNVFLTHTDTDTDTQIHMNICSFLWLVHITSKDGKWWIVFEW